MKRRQTPGWAGAIVLLVATCAWAEDATIRVDVRQPGRPLSRYLTGACIEDVNHEIYGGIYSQMIFGESFQEPARGSPIRNFFAVDGEWQAVGGEARCGGGPGPKLVSATPPFAAGEVGVEVYQPADAGGSAGPIHNAGLIVNVNKAGPGADNFDGYEVSIDAARKRVALGRHRHDYKLLKEADCDAGADRWVGLTVKLTGQSIEVSVDGKVVLQFEDDRPLKPGTIGLRQWQRPARYRNLWVKTSGKQVDLPFEPAGGEAGGGPVNISGMWGPVSSGTAVLAASVERDKPFVGTQSQRITFVAGAGEAGIENQGLNRWGLAFAAGKPLEGYLWLRAEKSAEVFLSLESRDGSRRYARTRLAVTTTAAGGEAWQRFDFQLTPAAADPAGRFALTLASPGSVVVGHAFLQPGEWGRFKGLPLRRDVVEGLIEQGVTVLRYGGSMVNAAEYRWKKMIGPRDRRPPYHGTWYPYSSNGWGILDFLDLCEAAGIPGVPAFNMDETPQDLADFVEYANGPAESEWGRRRAAAGHPEPYEVEFIELGNEEKIDQAYYEKFAAIAPAVWARDPRVTLVVGDFAYDRPIEDPMNFGGAASHITSLAAHRKILELAREHGREVWFDVHVWTDAPGASASLKALPSYIDALGKVAGGARHKVVVFELNSGNHRQRRALSNAQAIGTAQRDGRIPIVTSANCLQCDGENDNGWDQGLLFLNPTRIWLQPPGYVAQMIGRNAQPRLLEAEVKGPGGTLDVTATRGEDGKTVVLQVVNPAGESVASRIRLEGFSPSKPTAGLEELAGPLDARNTAETPEAIRPRRGEWRPEMKDGAARYTFPPRSFTILRFE